MQLWLDDVVSKKVADKDRVMRARWVLTWKFTDKANARLCILGFQDPKFRTFPSTGACGGFVSKIFWSGSCF